MANQYVNDVQQTILFHVDDLKVSCKDKKANEEVVDYLKNIYEIEELKGLKATKRQRHKYLGMILDFSTEGEVTIDMQEYVENMLRDFKEYIEENETAKTPAANWLFEVRTKK